MKVKNILIALLIFSYFSAKAQNLSSTKQEATVEKSLFHLQAGLVGIWAAYEHQIAPRLAMRYDIGVHSGFWGGSNRETGFATTPSFSMESRFYHNLNKRIANDKSIKGNSGNFLAIRLQYQPNVVLTTTDERRNSVTSYVSIMPKYGIRRMIVDHFNYELGFGLGYGYKLEESFLTTESRHFLDLDLHLRIGFTF